MINRWSGVPFLGLGTLGSGWQRQISLGDSNWNVLVIDGSLLLPPLDA